MPDASSELPSFEKRGPIEPATPVVLSVPHAGRHYPEALLAQSRLGTAILDQLADREADRLIEAAVAAGACAIVGRLARAWIDLNRDPRELDVGMVHPPPAATPLMATARMRAGLGLIPRRVPGHGEIARAPLAPGEVAERLHRDHEPYHRAITEALATARSAWGWAILLDIHSMPPLEGRQAARVVIGDRHGRSAGRRERELVLARARQRWAAVRNVPYSGAYTLDRHGRPARGCHAIQIEFDRSLYLSPDGGLDRGGAAAIGDWLAALVSAFTPEQIGLAAE